MVDLGVHRVTRTGLGRAVYAALSRVGVTGTSMDVYATRLASTEVTREPPGGVRVDVVRASELSVRPAAEFEDLAPSDFVAVARAAEAPQAASLSRGDEEAVCGWVFLTLEGPVSVPELATTVQFDGAYVWHLFVDPGERGRGVASALLDATVAFAAGDRLDAAYALVAKDNRPSQRVFEAVGFEVVDEVAYYRVFDWERRRGPVHTDGEYSL